jgi:hypothetical protein
MAHAHDSLYQAYAPEKYGCKTWKSGKSHSSADHCENGHSREIVLLCIVRNLASPSQTPMKLYSHLTHAHDTLYQSYAPEKYRCKTWTSGISHLSSDHCENGPSREIVLICIVRNLASPSKTPMKLYSHMTHAQVVSSICPRKVWVQDLEIREITFIRGSLWKWAFSRDCTTLHRQNYRKPF